MNKLFRHKIFVAAMMFGFMLVGASCEDTVGINPTAATPFADKKMKEVILEDSVLSDFVDVLYACGEHCIDSLFDQSRVYTLWAPMNGTFNKDSIIEKTTTDRDHVFRSFIMAHIANHLVPANGVLDSNNQVLLLNNKNALFTGNYKDGYTFSGVPLLKEEMNIRVMNGLLHKIAKPSEYKYSIWEYLKVAENVDSVRDYLYSFDVTEFNQGASLVGPVVNGQQTYIDSVFTTSNVWLNATRVGRLDSEDSTYVVYVPSNDMWEKAVELAESYFNYDLSSDNLSDIKKEERDSLRRYYARLHTLKFMTYSVKEQRHLKFPEDSAMPAYRGQYKRPLFAKEDLERYVIPELTKELSNGTFKVVDAMPYKPTDLWHDTIFLEGENTSMLDTTAVSLSSTEILYASKKEINTDSIFIGSEISGGAYFNLPKSEGIATVKFYVPKVLSAKYNVAIVFVPRNITNANIDKETMYKSKLNINVTQQPGKGSVNRLYDGRRIFTYTDPFKVDTLFLTVDGERDSERAVIQPKYCESYDVTSSKEYAFQIEVKTNQPTNKEKKEGINYDTSIRIDKILLIPVLDTEE